ncbi:Ubiquinone biosynthesis O-methyltransferase, mitochondrial [Frigidibacter albus]|jgi:SAM-dependent methyltransferase
MSVTGTQRFWNRVAARYAARPLKDVAAYEALLADVAGRLQPTDTVLEIGCGTGGTAIHLAPRVARWLATDFSSEMVRIAQAKPGGDTVSFAVMDAAQALDAGPFDVVCAFNVLHLVDDFPGTLAHIHRSLNPGGLLICKTWCFADVPLKLRLVFRVLRLFGLFPVASVLGGGQLRRAIQEAGFRIEADKVFGTYPQNPYIVARKSGGSTG